MPRGKPADLTGRQFGSWTVVKRAGTAKHKMPLWLCRCACGTEGEVRANGLVTGRSTQCQSCAHKTRAAKLRGRKKKPTT